MTMFDKIGSAIDDAAIALSGDPKKFNAKYPVVAPATGQLGSIIKPQAQSGLMNSLGAVGGNYNKGLVSGGYDSSVKNPGVLPSSSSVKNGATGGAMTPEQDMNSKHNAALMAQYGPGNYNIDANGNVTQKTQASGVNTAQQQANTNLASGKDINGNPVQSTQSTGNSTTFPNIISGIVDKSSQPSADYTDIKNKIAQNLSEQKQLTQDYAQKDKNIQGTAGFLTQATGLEGLLNRQYGLGQTALSQEYQGLSSQLGAANTQQGQQISGLTSAAGLAQPVNQLGLLTDPQNGKPLNPQVAQGAIQQAYQLIHDNKTDINDPNIQALIAPFGTWGQQALLGMLNSGGTFNPTSQSTQVGTNQSNLADTQKQAYSVNQNLQQIDRIEPVLMSFLKSSGINPYDAQIYNGPVNDYLTNIGNPGAAASWAAQMGDLKNYTSQLLASGYGGTPTGTEQQTISQDPSKLSYSGLQTYLTTLKGLGQNRLNVLQGNIKSLGGNSTGYSGTPTSGVNSVPSGTATSSNELGGGITSPLGQAAAGTGIKTFQNVTSVPGMIGAIIDHIFL